MISTKRKTADSAAISPKSDYLFDYATAAVFFRFLRQLSRPNAPRPVAKSGNADLSGVVVGASDHVPSAREYCSWSQAFWLAQAA
jgi:hypothetical protein